VYKPARLFHVDICFCISLTQCACTLCQLHQTSLSSTKQTLGENDATGFYRQYTSRRTLPGLSGINCETVVKRGNCRCPFRPPLSPGIPSLSGCRCISTHKHSVFQQQSIRHQTEVF